MCLPPLCGSLSITVGEREHIRALPGEILYPSTSSAASAPSARAFIGALKVSLWLCSPLTVHFVRALIIVWDTYVIISKCMCMLCVGWHFSPLWVAVDRRRPARTHPHPSRRDPLSVDLLCGPRRLRWSLHRRAANFLAAC